MRKLRLAILLSLAFSWSSALAQQVQGVTANSIKLGEMTSLTGSQAMYGVPNRAGTLAYFEMINAKGGVKGRTFNLLTEDHAYQTSQAIAIGKRFIFNDEVFAILNVNGGTFVSAILPFAKERKTVIFCTYGGDVGWFNPPQPNVYGMQVLYENQGVALAQMVAKDNRKKVVATYIEAVSFARGARSLEENYRSLVPGGSIDTIGVKIATQDYAPIALQIAQMKPDAIISMQPDSEFVALVRELRNQGVTVPIYAWAPVVTQRALDIGGNIFEGVKAISWTYSPFGDSPAISEYRESLKKYASSEKPDFVSFFNYGCTKIFVEAMSRVDGAITPESFANALYSLKNYETGIFPPVSFGPSQHQGTTALIPMEVKGGTWHEIGAPIDTSSIK